MPAKTHDEFPVPEGRAEGSDSTELVEVLAIYCQEREEANPSRRERYDWAEGTFDDVE